MHRVSCSVSAPPALLSSDPKLSKFSALPWAAVTWKSLLDTLCHSEAVICHYSMEGKSLFYGVKAAP